MIDRMKKDIIIYQKRAFDKKKALDIGKSVDKITDEKV